MATVLSRPPADGATTAGLVDPRAVVRKAQRKPFVPRPLQRLLGPVLLVVLWQVLSSSGIFDARTVPAPTTAVKAAWRLIEDGSLQEHLSVSLLRVGYGLLFGIALGVVLARSRVCPGWGRTSSTPTWRCSGRSRTSPWCRC